MDQQQCGDIDDDDYDQHLAAAGDDVAINPAQIEAELEEERPQMNPDSEEEEAEQENLDDDGKKIWRIQKGKPKVEEKEQHESDDQQAMCFSLVPAPTHIHTLSPPLLSFPLSPSLLPCLTHSLTLSLTLVV